MTSTPSGTLPDTSGTTESDGSVRIEQEAPAGPAIAG